MAAIESTKFVTRDEYLDFKVDLRERLDRIRNSHRGTQRDGQNKKITYGHRSAPIKGRQTGSRHQQGGGFGPPENLPTRINNPGDMVSRRRGWGTECGKTVYAKARLRGRDRDKTDEASALRRECFVILSGASHNFEIDWTFLQLAQEWTGGDKPNAWAQIVCQELDTEPEMTLRTYAAQAA